MLDLQHESITDSSEGEFEMDDVDEKIEGKVTFVNIDGVVSVRGSKRVPRNRKATKDSSPLAGSTTP